MWKNIPNALLFFNEYGTQHYNHSKIARNPEITICPVQLCIGSCSILLLSSSSSLRIWPQTTNEASFFLIHGAAHIFHSFTTQPACNANVHTVVSHVFIVGICFNKRRDFVILDVPQAIIYLYKWWYSHIPMLVSEWIGWEKIECTRNSCWPINPNSHNDASSSDASFISGIIPEAANQHLPPAPSHTAW